MSKKKTTKKPGKKLVKVTSPVKKTEAFFVATELADDALIEKEVLGQTTKTMVYEYLDENKNSIYGLSYQGVKEVVRIINRKKDSGYRIQISDKPPIIDRDITMESVSGVEVQVYAVDLESGGGSWGLKFEPWQKYNMKDGKGFMVHNKFALEQALSKAQRNAMFHLLPLDLVDKMIAKFVKEKDGVAKIEAPKTTTREIKPKASKHDKMYKATLDRVGKIKDNKKALEQALKNVDKMPINGKQRGQIRRKITTYLKKVK